MEKYLPPNGASTKVSTFWLMNVLQSHFGAKISVPLMEITLHNMSTGLIGQRLFKLQLLWPKGSPSLLPKNLIVKTVVPNEYFSSILLGSAREALFYKDFSQKLDQFRVLPKIYFAEGSMISGEFLILMEDLSLQDTVPGGHIFGNQCWGSVEIPRGIENDPVATLETIFLSMADVHAHYWRDTSLLKYRYLKATNWLQGRGRIEWEFGISKIKERWERLMASKVKFSDDIINAMSIALKNTSWDSFCRRLNIKDPHIAFTLCHGDFHANNLLWAGGAKKQPLFLVDWAEVGVFCPFTDLAQFLISNATIDLRRKNEKQLFNIYHKRLIQKGVSPEIFSLEVCWENYKAGGIERWLQMFIILASVNLDNPKNFPDFAVIWFQNQVQAFIQDHANDCKLEPGFISGYCLTL